MAHVKNEMHINLNALVYFDADSEIYVAHCLELDLVATGNSHEEAESNLIDVVEAHLEFAYQNDNWDYVYNPAPPEIWAEYAKLAAEGYSQKRHVRTFATERVKKRIPPMNLQLAYG